MKNDIFSGEMRKDLSLLVILGIVLVLGVTYFQSQKVEAAAGPVAVIKQVNEVHQPNPNLEPDSELVLSLKRNQNYILDGHLFFIQGGNNCNMAIMAPPDAQFFVGMHYLANDKIFKQNTDVHQIDCSDERIIFLRGSIQMGSTDGTLQILWSGGDTGAVVMNKGSWLRAEEI